MSNLNVIYYKNLLDDVMVRFFGEFGDSFRKDGESYVFSKDMSDSKLKRTLVGYLYDEIGKYVTEYSHEDPKFYFIIGSCNPSENILLYNIDPFQYFPKKLTNFISEHKTIKYVLKEDDIRIDIDGFNSVFEDIFNGFFSRKSFKGHFKIFRRNVFFIRHNEIDCYMLYRVMKHLYGKVNVCNLNKKMREGKKSPIRSVNEMIDTYVNNKKNLITSEQFKYIVSDVRQFMERCMLGDVN